MHYLVYTKRTTEYLNQHGQRYTIIDFYFDYRAGRSVANDLHGLVRMLLLQLCERFPSTEKQLAEKNVHEPLSNTSLNAMVTTFCSIVRRLPTNICIFLDGLDEYEGDYEALIQFINSIHDRTEAKICLASRPESTFERHFRSYPFIKMQDHNQASVEAYINEAMEKARESLMDIDSIVDDEMRHEILNRAQGVIIWARLAVDELLRAVQTNRSKQDLLALLDRLPEELEQMYERCVLHIRQEHTSEGCLLLYMIKEFGGSLTFELVYSLWHTFYLKTNTGSSFRFATDKAAFSRRLFAILGSLVDVFGEPFTTVRLAHKTLQAYLDDSHTVRSKLPEDFKIRYPDRVRLRVLAEVVMLAARTQKVCNRIEDLIPREYWSSITGADFQERQKTQELLSPWLKMSLTDSYWLSHFDLLRHSIEMIPRIAFEHEKSGQSSYPILRITLSSPLMVFSSYSPITYLEQRVPLSWQTVSEEGLLDLILAIQYKLPCYVRERLHHASIHNQMIWNSLFGLAVQCAELHLEDLAWSNTSWQQEMRIIWLIRQYSDQNKIALLHPCILTVQRCKVSPLRSTFFDDQKVAKSLDLCELLLSMKVSPLLFDADVKCAGIECLEHHNLIHKWWFLMYKMVDGFDLSDQIFLKVILHCILQTGVSVNSICDAFGTPLHMIMRDSPIAEYVVLLARLGADPRIKHKGKTPLDLKPERYTSLITFIKSHSSKRGKVPPVKSSEILRYYKQHGEWPDFTHMRLESSYFDAWKVDEAGQPILDDDDLNKTGLGEHLPEDNARWSDILSRYRDGTLYTDTERLYKKWLDF